MSDKSIYDAIMARDLNAVAALLYPTDAEKQRQYTHCDICDVNPGHREMMWGGIICESYDEKLEREQR